MPNYAIELQWIDALANPNMESKEKRGCESCWSNDAVELWLIDALANLKQAVKQKERG